MGFGILFIGYFLLLNVTYYSFTDIIASAIMLFGLYKLSKINTQFKISLLVCFLFLIIGGVEFCFSIFDMFSPGSVAHIVYTNLSCIRFAVIGALSVIILLGIRKIAIEVELEDVPTKSLSRIILTSLVYITGFVLELPFFDKASSKFLYILVACTILAELFVLVLNLIVIYSCYMRICMPSDNIPLGEKQKAPSRFAFVNQYRERRKERNLEEAEYRLKLIEEKLKKKNGGKKKK